MTEHTPGPWELRQSTLGHIGDSYYFLDHVQGGEGYSHVRFQPDEVSDADARLIAAAPDLLAVLCKVADMGENTASLSIGHTAALKELGRNARAAVERAKAKS